MKLSAADLRLLDALQVDATRSQVELAEIAGMSRTSCWRRIRDFEEAGLIERQVAIVNPRQVGLEIGADGSFIEGLGVGAHRGAFLAIAQQFRALRCSEIRRGVKLVQRE